MSDANDNFRTDLFEILVNARLFIVSFTLSITLIALVLIVLLPNFYTSSALLKVSFPDNNQPSSGLSAYAGLAGLAGVSLPTAQEDKGMVAIETIKSRSFLEKLVTFDNVLINIVAAKSYDFEKDQIIYDEALYDINANKWVNGEPTYLEAYEYYEEFMSISQNKATGFISLSYEHVSPKFSYEFISLIIKEINLLMKEKDIKESTDSLIYLEGLLEDTNNTNIKLQLNQMIENQLRTKMLSNIRDDYLLMPIDPPFIPEEKSSPRRSILSIMSLILGFILSIFFVLIKEVFFIKKTLNK